MNEATFSCLHRYTHKPICAIPCNGEDDMCLNDDDEDPALCKKRNPLPFIISVLIILLFIGCVLGERIYRLEFQTIEEQNRETDVSISEFLDHINNEQYDLPLLSPIFNTIHANGSVKELVKVLESRFESYKLKKVFQLLYRMELPLHEENAYKVELCLKKALGTNALAAKFLDYVTFSCFTKLNLKITNCLNCCTVKLGLHFTTLVTGTASLIIKVSLYYLDFIKDIIFIIFIKKLVPEASASFLSHLLVILIVIFCVSEVSKLHLVVKAKRSLNLSQRSFSITLLTFPFMPAILIYLTERLKYNHTMLNNSSRLESQIGKIDKLITRMKRNENTLENFPQLIIIVIIIGLALSPTATVTVLKGTIDPKDWILYTTASASALTIVRASVTQLKASLDGFLSFVGQLLYGAFIFISITSRLTAIFLYFSQNLGLLPILWHWKFGSIPAEANFMYDKFGKEMEFQEAWILTKDVTYYTWLSYDSFALIFIALVFAQIIASYTVKWKSGDKADIFGHALDSLLSPQTGDIFNIISFTFGNLLLIFPFWILKLNIAKYEPHLHIRNVCIV